MAPAALALILIAAILHTGWNLLVKRAGQKQIFTWWALAAGCICFFPLFALSDPASLWIVWPFIIASAAAEAAYYISLTRAYDISDFSLIYPLARGTAPIFLFLWSMLFLGERPAPMGAAGIFLIVLGLLVVGGQTIWSRRQDFVNGIRHGSMHGVLAAFGIALCISIYSVIDGGAVKHVSPVPYTALVLDLTTLMIAPAIWRIYGKQAMLTELRCNWPRIIAVGVMTLAAYMLVLHVYSLGRVSYAGAVREVSIVFAALIGWLWLGEEFGIMRVIGSLFIFTGILVIAFIG